MASIQNIDWGAAATLLAQQVSQEDMRLLLLLAQGKSTPQIAKLIGQSRSTVWRRLLRLRERL
jgi:DNA-binding CsgD family transcriptional regulator